MWIKTGGILNATSNGCFAWRDIEATNYYLERNGNDTIKVYRIFSKLVVSILIWIKMKLANKFWIKVEEAISGDEFPITGSDQELANDQLNGI